MEFHRKYIALAKMNRYFKKFGLDCFLLKVRLSCIIWSVTILFIIGLIHFILRHYQGEMNFNPRKGSLWSNSFFSDFQEIGRCQRSINFQVIIGGPLATIFHSLVPPFSKLIDKPLTSLKNQEFFIIMPRLTPRRHNCVQLLSSVLCACSELYVLFKWDPLFLPHKRIICCLEFRFFCGYKTFRPFSCPLQ